MINRGQYMDIKELRSEGLSIRDIARRTGLSRNTVRRVLRGEHPMQVRVAARASMLEPYRDYVRDRFERYQLSAVRLIEEIRPMGYTGSLSTLRRYLQGLRAPGTRLAKLTVRFETPPGKQAQADWAECGRFALPDGGRLTVYAFVMVLSFSRALFLQFTTSMRLAELMRCHQLAFEFFGGWPQQILYDNMKQVRTSGSQLNEAFVDFAEHYGLIVKTHRPYRPRTKGKVERLVDYVKDNFLAGRTFESLENLNAQAAHWRDCVANCRVHGTTGLVPAEQLALEALTPLGSRPPYQLSQPVRRTVTRDALVHYQGSRYSVPPAHTGQVVTVRCESGHLLVHCGDTIIADHRPALKAGQCIVAKEHVAELWRLALAQIEVPTAPSGERWHLTLQQSVAQMPLSRFDELYA
jgi:transposase